MDYHPLVERIKSLFEKNNFWFESFEHEPVRTSEEAAQIRSGYQLEQGAKAMLVRIKISKANKFFVMLVLPGDQRLDFSKVKALFKAKDVRFATEDEVTEISGGVQPGGVPPFGNLFDLEVIVDPSLLKNEKIIFNAGDRCFSVACKSQDWQTLVKPRVVEII